MAKISKIQISPRRIIPDVLTVWSEPGPEVDVVMDLRNLTFAKGSLELLVSFQILSHFIAEDVGRAMQNWESLMKSGGELFVVVDDFEFLARSFVGGDLAIEHYNTDYSVPTHFTSDNLAAALNHVGFIPDNIRIFYADVPNLFTRQKHELVMCGKKI